MDRLDELRQQDRMTWNEEEHGWVAAPEEIVNALSSDGFDECKRETTTSSRDSRPAGGVWQGIDKRTASVIWVNRPASPHAIMFIAIDGEAFDKAAASNLGADPYREDGGEA